MNILCLGISHHTASVTLRERISLAGEALRQALSAFVSQKAAFEPLTELAILSTCSRLEIYAAADSGVTDIFDPLLRFALSVFTLRRAELEPHLYRYSGEEAVRHLCRVAASLDSMVLGEPQILGQVGAAHQAALEEGSARHVLSALFRAAQHAGKRVRSETAIGRCPTNMSAVAIRLAESVLGNLTNRPALVIGTGEIGRQSLKVLHDYGIHNLAVASRSQERAAQVGREWNAQPVTVERLEEALVKVDVALSSSSQESLVIDRALAARVAEQRRRRPLALVDLAVPRNIDPAIRAGGAGVEGIHLFDMDDIQAFIASSLASRKNEIPRAEEIVQAETESFMRWLAVIPVVGELHRRAEAIRKQEVARALHILQDPDPAVVEQIERLSQSLVRKLLHEPTARLRHEADHANLETYMAVLTSLFDLPQPGGQMPGKGEAD